MDFRFLAAPFLAIILSSLAPTNFYPQGATTSAAGCISAFPEDTLSSKGWSGLQTIPLNLDNFPGLSLTAARHQKVTYLVFNTAVGPKPEDIYFTTEVNGKWTPPLNLSKSAAPSSSPRIAIDTTHTTPVLHVIWGEVIGESPLPFSRPNGGPLTDILYTNNKGGTWSKPISIFNTELPGLQLPRHVVVDKQGKLHLVFVAKNSDTRKPTIFYMKRSADTWSSPRPITDGRYADLIVLGEHRLLITYLRPDFEWARKMKTKDVNSVFVQQSSDGGKSWEEPTLVHRSGIKSAFAPHLLKIRDGSIHLFWRKSTDRGTFSNTLLHSYTQDGVSWTTPVELTPPSKGILASFDVIADPERPNTLHAVFQKGLGLPEPVFRFYHTQFVNGAWKPPTTLLPDSCFDFTKAGRAVALTANGDTLQAILRAKEKDRQDFLLYRLSRPLHPTDK